MVKRPMLAGSIEDHTAIQFPVICSPKLDGIRCLILNGEAVSRSLKPIPNHHVRNCLSGLSPLDGELVISLDNFQKTTSGIMTEDGEPNFTFHVFDYIAPLPYSERLKMLEKLPPNEHINVVETRHVNSHVELDEYEKHCLAYGYEGVMLRKPDGPYKQGRSTFKEGYLLKLKRFEDSEAEVIGFEEKMTNDNEPTINELGLQERSSHLAGMIPANTLGAVVVRDIKDGWQFKIGSGFNDEQRAAVWAAQSAYLGKILTYKYQKAGMKNLPRCPIFKGWRLD